MAHNSSGLNQAYILGKPIIMMVDDVFYAICDSISNARPWPSFVIPSYGHAGGFFIWVG